MLLFRQASFPVANFPPLSGIKDPAVRAVLIAMQDELVRLRGGDSASQSSAPAQTASGSSSVSTALSQRVNAIETVEWFQQRFNRVQSGSGASTAAQIASLNSSLSQVTSTVAGLSAQTAETQAEVEEARRRAILSSDCDIGEPQIRKGTVLQYWRGDKTWAVFPTSLPASDVYSWAKSATKPSYTAAEVGAATSGHDHSGVYEPAISKSTGFAKWTGSAWVFDNSTYQTAQSVTGLVKSTGTTRSAAVAGTDYEAPIASGTTAKYWRGDKTWVDFATDVRAAVLTGLSTATNAVITAADSVLSALGKLQKQITDNLATLTSHTGNTGNPHGVTKSQVGLGNAENTADADKPVSTAQQAALDELRRRNILGA
jgi:hypothetical protein